MVSPMSGKPKGDGQIMKLPRFSYQIPEDLTTDVLQEMKEEYRESPGDCITAILRKHFNKKMEVKALSQFATESPEDQEIPYFGPKPAKSESAQAKAQSAGEE